MAVREDMVAAGAGMAAKVGAAGAGVGMVA
jgi:hypothetical protein